MEANRAKNIYQKSLDQGKTTLLKIMHLKQVSPEILFYVQREILFLKKKGEQSCTKWQKSEAHASLPLRNVWYQIMSELKKLNCIMCQK